MKLSLSYYLTFVSILSCILSTNAQSGSLDFSFSSDGYLTTAIGSNDDVGYDVAIQSNGKIVVVGYSVGTTWDLAMVRYNTDGSLDNSFGTSGKVVTDINGGSDIGNAIAIQTDGKIIVAGVTLVGTGYDMFVARYTSTGVLDMTFGTSGFVTIDLSGGDESMRDILIQPDGKLLLVGYTHNGSTDDMAVVRLNGDGTFDTSFDSDGKLLLTFGSGDDHAETIVRQTNGKLIVVGYANTGTTNDIAIARLNTDGSFDTSFDVDGGVTTSFGTGDDRAYGAVIQNDGKLVVAGYSYLGTNNDMTIVRYNTNGSLDATFSTDGGATASFGTNEDKGFNVLLQPDGKLVVTGPSYGTSGADFALVRFKSNGELDASFGTNGGVLTSLGSSDDIPWSSVLQSDNKIVCAGTSKIGSYDYFAVARYLNSLTGIDEQAENGFFTMFPNPANETIHIKFPESSSAVGIIEIVDSKGAVILRKLLEKQGQVNFDLGNVSPGLYLLQVVDSEKKFSKKFVKQ